MDDALAKVLFDIWRTDQTGDTWRQLSDSERAAWVRVAEWVRGISGRAGL